MPSRIDITGCKFGRLTVTKQVGSKYNRPLWECQCECGEIVTTQAGQLRAGAISQCGNCGKSSRIKHGCSSSKKQSVTREYSSWNSARQRCRNAQSKSYPDYGGRGIKFDPVWDDFSKFLADMGPCPVGHEIDRIDVDGDYAPGNCRWVTEAIQSNNKRSNRYIEHQGKTQTLAQWANEFGVKPNTLGEFLSRGGSIEEYAYRVSHGLKRRKLSGKVPIATCKQIKDEYLAIPIVNNSRPKGTLKAIATKYGISKAYVMAIAKTTY